MFGRCDDLIFARAGFSQSDVGANRVVKENSFLCDNCDLVAEIFGGDFADIGVPDINCALGWIIKAEE